MPKFERLKSVLDEILRTFDLDRLLKSIVKNLQKLDFDRAGVFLIDEDRQLAQGTWGTDEGGNLERISEQEFPADFLTSEEGYYVVGEKVLKEKLSIDAPDLFLEIGEEEKFQQLFGYMPPSPGYYKRVELGDNFSFPIVVENKTIGSIAVDNYISHRQISEEDAQLLSMFVSLAGIAIQNANQQTKRMQAEEALKESEQRYKYLVDNSDDVFLIISKKGKILFANKKAMDISGYSEEEIIGQSILKFLTKDSIPKALYAIGQEFLGRPQLKMDVKIKTKSGDLRDLEIAPGSEFAREKGKLVGILINARDITEQKQMEEKIKRRNRELEEINQLGLELSRQISIDSILETLFTFTDAWGNIKFLDYDFSNIGLVEGDYLSFKAGIWEDSEYKLAECLRIKIGEGITGHAVVTGKTIVCQDVTQEPRYIPSPDWTDKTCAELVVLLKSGEQVIGVLDIHHGEKNCFSEDDIVLAETLARYIAAALERAELFEKLRDSEEMYRALVQASPNAIIMSDLTGKIIQANSRAAELGRIEDESKLIGLNSFDFIAQKDQASARKDLERTLRDGFIKDVEYTCLRTDGTQYSAELSVSLIRNTEGESTAFVGIVRDITERKRLEEQLRQKQKLEAVGELAGGIAHDFNNILTAITGYVSLMMMQMNESHPFYNAVKTIQEASRRAAELTHRLLSFARGGKFLTQPVDLNNSVNNVLRLTRETFDRAIDIETNLDENLSIVEGDPGQLEQVLLNLCLNARDAMPTGGTLTIETSNVIVDEDYARTHLDVEVGKYVLLQVTDTGIGMSSEIKQRIFEPFFSLKEEETGMGLAMVYGIVKNHDGAINVYSEVGKGTTFKIYLPTLEKEVTEEETKLEEKLPRGSESILIVDDEQNIRNVGRDMLESLGYRVYLAENGVEACKIYESKMDEIELVLLDIIMPEMGGKETYRQLKKMDSNVRVVLVSGYSINDQVREILNDGAMDFVQKPFDTKRLASIVRKILDVARGKMARG